MRIFVKLAKILYGRVNAFLYPFCHGAFTEGFINSDWIFSSIYYEK